MTVGEMIAALSAYPQNLPIVNCCLTGEWWHEQGHDGYPSRPVVWLGCYCHCGDDS